MPYEHVLTSTVGSELASPTVRRSKFFFGLSAAMLAGVVLGFSRTYYLRSVFGTEDMVGGAGLPAHLHVHGFVMSAWFAFVVGQTLLIQKTTS